MGQKRFTLSGLSKVKTIQFELRGQALPFIATSSLRGDVTNSVVLSSYYTVDSIISVLLQ